MIALLEGLYEKLWRKVGGRPWTEIIRDEQKKSPLVFLLIFVSLGILAGKLAGKYWWQILIGFLLGILCGHFWW
jgi:predicted MFS family arabinose efflux permease